jgi:hypothetical protein
MIDSVGLGTIASLYVSARTAGGELYVVNLAPRLRELFSVTRLLSLFESAGSPPEGGHYELGQRSTSGSGDSAGPASTSPVGLKREPWHGQSHVRSPCSKHLAPMCVHVR